MKVGLLNTKQKKAIDGKEFAPDSYFNPIQDINGNWVISLQEIEQCKVEEFIWLNELKQIEYVENEQAY
jgi:hypothetical protein